MTHWEESSFSPEWTRKCFIQKRIFLIPGSPLEVIGIFIEDHFCEKKIKVVKSHGPYYTLYKQRKHKNTLLRTYNFWRLPLRFINIRTRSTLSAVRGLLDNLASDRYCGACIISRFFGAAPKQRLNRLILYRRIGLEGLCLAQCTVSFKTIMWDLMETK